VGDPPAVMVPSTSPSSGRSPAMPRRSNSTPQTTFSHSMSRTRTPDDTAARLPIGSVAPCGLLPNLIPLADRQEGRGQRSGAGRDARQGRGSAPSRRGSRPCCSSPVWYRTSCGRWGLLSCNRAIEEYGVRDILNFLTSRVHMSSYLTVKNGWSWDGMS
jgi:hypothetical protein